jgi:hypothetical protein
MIVNVINGQSSGAINSNPFPGMSLAEACGEMKANVSDILSEMNMGILLNEHMYLRENGTDIEYVNEAGFELKQKVTDAISKVGAKISELWDKLVKWVQERVEDVRLAFARASVNKKKAEDIASKLADDANVSESKLKLKIMITTEQINKMVSDLQSFDPGNFDNGQTVDAYLADSGAKFREKYSTKDPAEFVISKKHMTDAIAVVFDTDRNVVPAIRTAKKNMLAGLDKLKNKIKGDDAEDKADQLKNVNTASRQVSSCCSEAIKLFHTYVDINVKILQAGVRFKGKDESKAEADKKKAEKEEAKKKKEAEKAAKKSEKHESAIFSGDRFFSV